MASSMATRCVLVLGAFALETCSVSSSDTDTATDTTTNNATDIESPGPTARLNVAQQLGLDAYVYVEGARSHLLIISVDDGSEVAEAVERLNTEVQLLSVDLPLGRYRIESWQVPNNGDLTAGSETADRCDSELDLQRAVEVLVVVTPGLGCSIETKSASSTPTD